MLGVEDQEALGLHRPRHAIGGRLVEMGRPGQLVEAPLRMVDVEEGEHPKTSRQGAHHELVVTAARAGVVDLGLLPSPAPGGSIVRHR